MNKKTVERLEQIKFENMEIILQVLGFIESKGGLFQKKNFKMTRENMDELLDILEPISKKGKKNLSEISNKRRQMANALSLFNRLSNSFLIEGDKSGTHFKNRRSGSTDQIGLREDNAYQAFLVLYLSILLYKGSIYLDILAQFLELDHPIDFLTSIQYFITKKLPVSFSYQSDRNNRTLKVDGFVPIKIYFKDNHWFLVGWDVQYKNWNQYLLHSIKEINPSSKKVDMTGKEFSLSEFRTNAFGSAVLNKTKKHTIHISVPASRYNAVRKRRKEGTWDKSSDPYTWSVETFDVNEVSDYIFRWNGILKIKSPESIKKQFQTKLRSFLD